MFKTLREDIKAVFERDPAARSTLEVLICYPGLHAVTLHRVSHWFWTHDWKLVARMLSQLTRFFTGIEIHPGAKLGRRFFIDHGMGVVIGETSEIGDNVTIYHGVTLGGTSWKKEKRHPTLGDNVVVGAGAKILGPIVVGENSRIGSGSVVVKDVPPNSVVVGVPGKVTHKDGVRIGIDLNQTDMPDPVAQAIHCMLDRIRELERRVEAVAPDADKAEKQPAQSECRLEQK